MPIRSLFSFYSITRELIGLSALLLLSASFPAIRSQARCYPAALQLLLLAIVPGLLPFAH